jgi:hypothetical protein
MTNTLPQIFKKNLSEQLSTTVTTQEKNSSIREINPCEIPKVPTTPNLNKQRTATEATSRTRNKPEKQLQIIKNVYAPYDNTSSSLINLK